MQPLLRDPAADREAQVMFITTACNDRQGQSFDATFQTPMAASAISFKETRNSAITTSR
jgi:hypothetical protein